MKPVNNKSLLHFLFDQMEKLDNGTLGIEEAKAQANLAKQANNALMYEIKRSETIMKIKRHNREFNDNVDFREVEGINF